MDYYFISDDQFYLAGLQEISSTEFLRARKFFLNAGDDTDMRQFLPSPGDVVIIAVDNLRLRRSLMKHAALCWCRLFLLPDVAVTGVPRNTFPVILPRRIAPEALLSYLRSASVTDIDCQYGSEKMNILLHGLSSGISVSEMEKIIGIPARYIYKSGRDIRREYGLNDCNISGLLICHEILAMKMSRKVSRWSDSGVTASHQNNRERSDRQIQFIDSDVSWNN